MVAEAGVWTRDNDDEETPRFCSGLGGETSARRRNGEVGAGEMVGRGEAEDAAMLTQQAATVYAQVFYYSNGPILSPTYPRGLRQH